MKRIHRQQERRHYSGFTLIEMLISVTLVLLMMTLFSTILSTATHSMSVQRGIAENDQKVRSAATVLQADLEHRSMRYAYPFFPGETEQSPTPFGSRAGYLYLSTNDVYSGQDDLLQFTVDANILLENQDDTPYFGVARLLGNRSGGGITYDSIPESPNQPEADDSSLDLDNKATSSAAEVCLFVRNGSLYRRVTLIREPLAVAGLDFSADPTANDGYVFFSGQPDPADTNTYDGMFAVQGVGLTNDFRTHFDFSAVVTGFGAQQHAQLIGISGLANGTAGAAALSFGDPRRRFGFNPFTGLSREHTSFAAYQFFGRFTHAETSSTNFNWPQNVSVTEGVTDNSLNVVQNNVLNNGNPLDLTGCPLTLNTGNRLISEFDNTVGTAEGRGGVRRMEDLLMSGVHELKVELWDERLGKFVTPGHNEVNPATGEAGDLSILRCLNLDYGPAGAAGNGGGTPSASVNHIFDTWHPTVNLDGDVSTVADNEVPPYLPYRFYPPKASDDPPGPSPDTMPGSTETYWQPGTQYSVDDIVFAPVDFSQDTNPDGATEAFEWDEDADGIPSQAFQIAYRCIEVGGDTDGNGTANQSGAVVPGFSRTPGRRTTDNEVVWESLDNRRPISAMRIKIRFMNDNTGQMRDMTLVQKLTD